MFTSPIGLVGTNPASPFPWHRAVVLSDGLTRQQTFGSTQFSQDLLFPWWIYR
jgi:hypothetical protein